MASNFVRAYPPAVPAAGAAFWLPFWKGELVALSQPQGVVLLQGEADLVAGLEPGEPLYLGTLDGLPCLACEVSPAAELAEDWRVLGLRALYGQLEEPAYGLAGYASQLLHWERTSRFCSSCGQPTGPMKGDWGRRCTSCGHVSYPHVNPAVLALVYDGDRILLTHKAGWGNRYSIIAGFVEPGETLEECVQREVLEEAGVELTDPVYFGSQPWPFPHQIMVAFMARYTGGEIAIDENELDDAKWFDVNALPELPGSISLSRTVIDAWIASRRG